MVLESYKFLKVKFYDILKKINGEDIYHLKTDAKTRRFRSQIGLETLVV